MRRLLGPIVAALSFAVAGCASITGTIDEVTVNSEPPGAECRVERMARPVALIKETPATVGIPRSHFPVDIMCTKEGFAGAQTIKPGVNPFTYGNIVTGGVTYLFDSLVDADRSLPEAVIVRFPVLQ